MAREFEIRREVELPATPEQVWEAVATGPGNAGWLWPMEIEPGVGSAAEVGAVTAWEPARHFAVRAEGENGWFNALEFLIEARDGGTAVLRYVHSGIPDYALRVDTDNADYDKAARYIDQEQSYTPAPRQRARLLVELIVFGHERLYDSIDHGSAWQAPGIQTLADRRSFPIAAASRHL